MAVISRQSIEDIIAALRKGEATLDQIAHRLEEEAEQRFCKPGEVNPVQLVKRIRKLASELPKLQASCQELLSAKQGLVDAAQNQLVANYNLLKQVCDAAGAKRLNDEEFNSFKESVGELNRKLHRHSLPAGQLLSRMDINHAIARNAMATHV
ncbi:hypothetical protein Vafri_4487 [Volvox africanus]|uniref:Protein FAM33A n=1 Tax=Volvox africanus TaxID=51714 RepID=A0A8J4ATX2_9CHLO|nr:hypothetical protein Vafri_4487 [Volvox africanus]